MEYWFYSYNNYEPMVDDLPIDGISILGWLSYKIRLKNKGWLGLDSMFSILNMVMLEN